MDERVPKGSFDDARWVPLENQHITMRFLGSTPEERVPAVIDACDAAVRGRSRPTLVPATLGVFPSLRRARVLWVGFDEGDASLRALAAALTESLAAAGWQPEERRFAPHLTVARFRDPKKVDALPALPPGAPSFEVEDLRLYRSHLSPKGSRYEVVARFDLA